MLPYAFERYLKLYHLLELSFDHDTVEKIRGLGQDLHGIGQILAQHKRDEFDRLKQLLLESAIRFLRDIVLDQELLATLWAGTAA